MSKRILILIIVLAAILAGLLYVRSSPKTQNVSIMPPQTLTPTPLPVAQTALSFLPSSFVIASPSGTLNLTIDSNVNKITAVQVELAFDPQVISGVDITPGTFFDTPVVLLKNIDAKGGKLTYILAIPPSGTPKMGTGTVANISFTTSLLSGQKTEFTFLPKTLVTAEGIETSVLKKSTAATIFYVKQATSSGEQMMGPVKP